MTENFRIDELFSNLIVILQVFSPSCSLTGLDEQKSEFYRWLSLPYLWLSVLNKICVSEINLSN